LPARAVDEVIGHWPQRCACGHAFSALYSIPSGVARTEPVQIEREYAEPLAAANGSSRATVAYIEDSPSNLRLVERAVAAYMTKPIDVRLLLETVNRYVAAAATR
jgi:hypothetical protein